MYTFIIFEIVELDKIDINEVEESEKKLLINSLDKLLTFVRYATEPKFVQNLTTIQGYYTESEIANMLQTNSLWNPRLV